MADNARAAAVAGHDWNSVLARILNGVPLAGPLEVYA